MFARSKVNVFYHGLAGWGRKLFPVGLPGDWPQREGCDFLG